MKRASCFQFSESEFEPEPVKRQKTDNRLIQNQNQITKDGACLGKTMGQVWCLPTKTPIITLIIKKLTTMHCLIFAPFYTFNSRVWDSHRYNKQ